ncbi:MAG: cytochrome-c peroxidase [Alphaproteobacteria bacterium]|nr:cytochrome-c peroxidase [Alphaproteobacteria bacterium]
MVRLSMLAALASTAACSSFDDTVYSYADTPPEYYRTDSTINGAIPPGFQAASLFNNAPSDNRVTNEGAALGRMLFYDENLSQNRTIACASCHKAEHGFADDRVLSVGFDGGDTKRHSMRLANARYYENGRFFWDQRAETLEDQVLMPFQDPVEMGMTLDEVVERVEEERRYEDYFVAAFGDANVDADRISKALAQFVRSMVSTTSRYDEGRAAVDSLYDPFPNFTQMENLGKELFYAPPPLGGAGCAHCHGTDAQIAFRAISNGLDAQITDPGYGEVTGNTLDQGTFKVPSLRNVAVGGPYMHDGRFSTLEEVIDHYSEGVQYHPTLFPFLLDIDGNARPLGLSDIQKQRLVAFLETLTDEAMLADPKFSNPW